VIEPALIVVSARGSGGQENKGQENIGKQGLPFSCPLFSCPLAGMTIEAIEPWGSQMQSRPGEPWTSRKRGTVDGSSAAAFWGVSVLNSNGFASDDLSRLTVGGTVLFS